MAPLVIRESISEFRFGPAPGTIVDMSCHAYALELGSDTETIDIATFCEPGATDLGRTTQTAVLSLLWSKELYDDLLPHVGEQGTFVFQWDANDVAPVDYVMFQTRYGALPWGRFEVGQRVEVELPLAVLSTIELGVSPPAELATTEAPAA